MTTGNKSADIGTHGINAGADAMSARADIKKVLIADLRECPLSRAEVAERLTEECCRRITETQIDAYTAASKEHRFPAEMVAAWVKVTGSRRLLALICEEAGLYLASQTDRELAEMGRAQIAAEKAAVRRDDLKGRLWHKV